MWVLVIYVVLMIVGDVLDVGIGAVAAHILGRSGQPADLPRLPISRRSWLAWVSGGDRSPNG